MYKLGDVSYNTYSFLLESEFTNFLELTELRIE